MTDNKEFSLWEVEDQTEVERVDCSYGENDYGYEPQCMLMLKSPGRFSTEKITGSLHGKAALHQFKKGDLVTVKFRFWSWKTNHDYVNTVTINDIKLVKNLRDISL